MNGAEGLIRTLLACGVDTCFTNPGTSEMHFVAALDRVEGMRCVLGLFEGVVTGAADGYGRMKDRPASTLLHLGPGLGNGLANLHNARRAIVVNGRWRRARALEAGGGFAAATGAGLLCPRQMNRAGGGGGGVSVDRIPSVVEGAQKRLAHLRRLVLINSKPPVNFFAYP